MGQSLERGGEETGDKQHQKAEGDLRGDEGVHHAAAGVRILAAFEDAGGFDGGSAEGRRETEEQRYGEGERESESQDVPIGGQREPNRIIGRVDPAYDERRGPPGENGTSDRRRE